MKAAITIIVIIKNNNGGGEGRTGRGKEAVREGNKTQEKQEMLNAFTDHTLADAQPTPHPAASSLYTGHDVPHYGISPWPLWVRCPSHAPSQLLVALLPGRIQETEKSLA